MESLYFLVPCALIFIALAIKALFWAINNGQYDNLDTEAHRILFDADAKQSPTTTTPPVSDDRLTGTQPPNTQLPDTKLSNAQLPKQTSKE